jgi:TonB family protein
MRSACSFAAALIAAASAVADDAYHRCSEQDLAAFRDREPSGFNPAEFVLPMEPVIKGHASGVVDLLVRVGTDGSVRKVCVVDSTPVGVFETVTVEAVAKWRYAAADVATLPKGDRRRMKIRVGFSLK